MFVLMEEDKAKEIKDHPVTINIPGDGGAVTKAAIRCNFLLLPQDEIDAIIQSARDGDDEADLMSRVWTGWSGVQDASGAQMEFSVQNRAKLLKIPYVRTAVTRAYFCAIAGEKPKK